MKLIWFESQEMFKHAIVLLFKTVTVACAIQERNARLIEMHRELESGGDYPSFAPTDLPTAEYTLKETAMPSNSTEFSSSSSSHPGISNLEFAIGFLIIAVSFLVFACVVAAIKKNTSCYEDHVIGADLVNDFDDDASDDAEDASQINGISLSGIKRDKSALFSRQRKASSGPTITCRQGQGAEFVKLRHFEDSSASARTRTQQDVSICQATIINNI